jgi:ribonuclease BN (tRNA processing enzyme)
MHGCVEHSRPAEAAVELTVLGCSGSFSSPSPGACSGYLVRDGDTAVWMDCGNGTFEQLQKYLAIDDLTAVIITHAHPDHSVDLYGLHIAARYAQGREGIPVYGPDGFHQELGALLHDAIAVPIHVSAHQAGVFARAARAQRLLITHVRPQVSIDRAVLEASEAYGDTVTAAAMHLVTQV